MSCLLHVLDVQARRLRCAGYTSSNTHKPTPPLTSVCYTSSCDMSCLLDVLHVSATRLRCAHSRYKSAKVHISRVPLCTHVQQTYITQHMQCARDLQHITAAMQHMTHAMSCVMCKRPAHHMCSCVRMALVCTCDVPS